MATYKKALKTLKITTVGGATINVSDTAEAANASNALAQFDAYKTMYVVLEGKITEVPFHAVDNIEITSTTADVEKQDAYGCDDSNESAGDDSNESAGD